GRRPGAEEKELVVERAGIPESTDAGRVQEQRPVRVHIDFLARIGITGPEYPRIGFIARPIVGRKLDIAERDALAARGIDVSPAVHIEVALPGKQRLAVRERDTHHRIARVAEAAADQGADGRFTAAALLGGARLNVQIE